MLIDSHPLMTTTPTPDKLVVIEEHKSFATASRKAKELAMQFNECTGIEFNAVDWNVLASEAVLSVISKYNVESDDLYNDLMAEEYQSEINEEYQNEVSMEILEEMQSDQDDLARSEEEGWLYED
jgi:hypothetical protein